MSSIKKILQTIYYTQQQNNSSPIIHIGCVSKDAHQGKILRIDNEACILVADSEIIVCRIDHIESVSFYKYEEKVMDAVLKTMQDMSSFT
jgi:hypothetical protein